MQTLCLNLPTTSNQPPCHLPEQPSPKPPRQKIYQQFNLPPSGPPHHKLKFTPQTHLLANQPPIHTNNNTANPPTQSVSPTIHSSTKHLINPIQNTIIINLPTTLLLTPPTNHSQPTIKLPYNPLSVCIHIWNASIFKEP
jgi:hypothetical protein